MRFYVGTAVLAMVALFEAAVLPLFRIDGLQPNLTLIVLVVWLMIRGEEEVYVLIPVGGLLLGLVDGALLGTALIALAPIALLQEMKGGRINAGGLALALAFVVVMSFFYNYTFLAVFTLQGQAGNWLTATRSVVLPTVVLNALVMVPVYFVFQLLNPLPRRSLYA